MAASPQPWESRLIRLLAEQQGIPLDQLARFIGCDEAQAARLVRHLAGSGYADYGRILHDEPHWAWLTWRGLGQTGMPGDAVRPGLGAIERMRAVNEVRLHIAARAPEARWLCSRSIVMEQGRRGHQPNAVVELADERHAIAVRLRRAAKELLVSAIETYSRRHHAVIVFCNAEPLRQLERLAAERHWAKLVIREIPG